ncbi:DUF2203 domain-containing protein [Plantactinospora sp. B5E13]|uniref:DUF2203 domain-containing protein n=1 Tax=unclassified Plantactinospora TaxID=2631981 RepID=UPI00325EF272
MFTLAQARHLIATLRPRIDELVRLRADLAELRVDLAERGAGPAERDNGPTGRAGRPVGGLAEVKSLEARIFGILEELTGHDIQVKGLAPVLLDFPGERDGRPVVWCWLEGDGDVGWYHRVECGFQGRRPV